MIPALRKQARTAMQGDKIFAYSLTWVIFDYEITNAGINVKPH